MVPFHPLPPSCITNLKNFLTMYPLFKKKFPTALLPYNSLYALFTFEEVKNTGLKISPSRKLDHFKTILLENQWRLTDKTYSLPLKPITYPNLNENEYLVACIETSLEGENPNPRYEHCTLAVHAVFHETQIHSLLEYCVKNEKLCHWAVLTIPLYLQNRLKQEIESLSTSSPLF